MEQRATSKMAGMVYELLSRHVKRFDNLGPEQDLGDFGNQNWDSILISMGMVMKK